MLTDLFSLKFEKKKVPSELLDSELMCRVSQCVTAVNVGVCLMYPVLVLMSHYDKYKARTELVCVIIAHQYEHLHGTQMAPSLYVLKTSRSTLRWLIIRTVFM